MADRPILFNTEMVKAILEGRKTQTRRIVKPNTRKFRDAGYIVIDKINDTSLPRYSSFQISDGLDERCIMIEKPFNVGDVLWVRETFCDVSLGHPWYYKADGDLRPEGWKGERWIPSIHMPKEAARIFLKVKGVRAELLRDMNDSDLENEGFRDWIRFISLWNSTIKSADCDKYDWNANPWVWVIEFERCEKPEGWC